MTKLKKGFIILTAVIMAVCLFAAVWILLPEQKSAGAVTYTVSSSESEKIAGTEYYSAASHMTVDASGAITAFTAPSNKSPFYLIIPEKIGNTVVRSVNSGVFSGTNILSLSFENPATRAQFIINEDSWGTDSALAVPDASSKGAFSQCTMLQEVILPADTYRIGNGAFLGCTALTSITIPNKVDGIGAGAFAYCTSLKDIKNLENSKVTYLRAGVFYNCSSLAHINTQKIKRVYQCAFTNCSKLTRVDLRSVEQLYQGPDGNQTFDGCPSLVEACLRSHITYYYNTGNDTGYNTVGYTSRSTTRCAGLLSNLFNLYFYDGSKFYGQSYYHETEDGYVFVKNAQSITNTNGGLGNPWCPTSTVLANNNSNYGTSVQHTWTIYYEADFWYLVAYNGDGGSNNDVPMEFPSSFTAPDGTTVTEYDVVEDLFNIEHAHNVKISSAVRAIGNRAFRGSSCQVMDMSAATNLTYVGAGYLDLVSAPIVYLPNRTANTSTRTIGSLDSLNNDVNVPVHIGRHINNDYSIPSMIIMPSYAAYTAITTTGTGYAHSWSYYGSFVSEMTYIINVNLHYDSATGNVAGSDKYDVEERLYGKAYNYAKNSNGTWSTDSSIILPKQQGYSTSVWYTDKDYNNKVGNVEEINLPLNVLGQGDINLYAKTVYKPNYNSQDKINPQDPNHNVINVETKIYDKKSYSVADGLGDLLNGYFPQEAVATISMFYPAGGGTRTDVTTVHAAGTYIIKVQLNSDYGAWSEPVTINLTIERAEIDLTKEVDAENNTLKYLLFSVDGSEVLAGGDVYVDTETNMAYREKSDSSYAEHLGLINSIANSASGERKIGLSSFMNDYGYLSTTNELSAIYGAEYNGETGQNAGVYTTTVTLNINDQHSNNYYFTTKDSNYVNEKYGITVEFTSRSSIRVTKVWYIVTANNWFIVDGADTETTYGVSGWVFNSFTDEVKAPDVKHGEKSAITFTLKSESGFVTEAGFISSEPSKVPVAKLGNYVNNAMPVGKYTITFYAVATTDDNGAAIQAFSSPYNFEVTNASLTSAEKTNALINKTNALINKLKEGFRLLSTEGGVAPYDDETQELINEYLALGEGTLYTRNTTDNIWSHSSYDDCYQYITRNTDTNEIISRANSLITYNTGSMAYDEYTSNIEGSLESVGVHTVYYQINAKNYNNLVNVQSESDRANHSYAVTIYTKLGVPYKSDTLAVEYTGGRVVPTVAANFAYRIYFDTSDIDTYVNGGIHYIYFALNEPTLYEWVLPEDNATANKATKVEYVSVEVDSVTWENAIIKIPFLITTAQNGWTSTPTITSWTYGDSANNPVASTKFGGKAGITYTYYLADWAIGENPVTDTANDRRYQRASNTPVADISKSDAGVYILRADAAAASGEYSSYSGIWEEYVFTIYPITNGWEQSPSVISWQWNGYNRLTNLFTAVPNHVLPKYGNNKAEAVLWTVWRGNSTKVTDSFRLEYDQTNGVWVVPQAAADAFNTLEQGTYYIEFAVESSVNFTEITNASSANWIPFEVSIATNTWTKTSNIFSWEYGSFNNGKDISNATAYYTDTVHYAIYSSYNPTTKVGVAAHASLADFALDGDSKVTDTVLAALNSLAAREEDYYLRVWTVGATGKYTPLDGYNTFTIDPATNVWETYPKIQPWVLGNWSIANNSPVGVAKYGNVTFTIKNSKGETVYTATYDETTKQTSVDSNSIFYKNDLDTSLAGVYTLSATVSGKAGQYTALTATDAVTFEVYLSSDSVQPNTWQTVPTIDSWTAGDTPNTVDSGEPARGKDRVAVVYYKRVYDEETHTNAWDKLSAAPTDGIGSYRARVEVYEAGHRDYLYIDVYFEIFARSNYWVNVPAIGDWFLSETAPNPVAAAYVEGTTYEFLYKPAGLDDTALTDVKPTAAGDYVMVVIATAEHCEELRSEVKFTVMLSTNTWTTIPVIENWSEEFSDQAHDPVGAAQVGTVTYTWYTRDGKQLESKPTEEGEYVMKARVEQFGYEPLEAEYEFVIEPAFDQTLIIIDGVLGLIACGVTIMAIVVILKKRKNF